MNKILPHAEPSYWHQTCQLLHIEAKFGEILMPHHKFHIDELSDFPRMETSDEPEPFHEVIAYWLATLCDLSYCTSSEIARTLKQLSFKEVTFFGFRGTYGFLTSHPDSFSVLVFRGTMKD